MYSVCYYKTKLRIYVLLQVHFYNHAQLADNTRLHVLGARNTTFTQIQANLAAQ
jgi:hypothetical protein